MPRGKYPRKHPQDHVGTVQKMTAAERRKYMAEERVRQHEAGIRAEGYEQGRRDSAINANKRIFEARQHLGQALDNSDKRQTVLVAQFSKAIYLLGKMSNARTDSPEGGENKLLNTAINEESDNAER
jgi:hypothetical protein